MHDNTNSDKASKAIRLSRTHFMRNNDGKIVCEAHADDDLVLAYQRNPYGEAYRLTRYTFYRLRPKEAAHYVDANGLACEDCQRYGIAYTRLALPTIH